MRIAAISDVHGNFELLQLVWQMLDKLGLIPATTGLPVLNAGDNVAYGIEDNLCVEFLRDPANNILSVAGNYDRNVARFNEKEESFVRKWSYSRPEKLLAIRQSSESITPQNREWLEQLPKGLEIEFGGANFIVTHYRPGESKHGLLSFTPDSEFRKIAEELDGSAQVVITGHTHTPYIKFIGGVLFVNPGSVGRPLEEPTFAVIDISNGGNAKGEIIECLV